MHGSTPKELTMDTRQCQLIHKYVIPYVKLNTSTSFISKLAFIFKLYVHQKLFNNKGISKCLTFTIISTCTENIFRKQARNLFWRTCNQGAEFSLQDKA